MSGAWNTREKLEIPGGPDPQPFFCLNCAQEVPADHDSATCTELYHVECMECGRNYTGSSVPGSTGLCDECLDENYPEG